MIGVLLTALGVGAMLLPSPFDDSGARPAAADPLPSGVAVFGPASTASVSPSASAVPSSRPSSVRPTPTRSPRRSATAPKAAAGNTALEDQVTTLVNQERAKAGCGAVRTDDRLRTAARGHSQDMATNGYFSHTGRDGSDFVDRAAAAGYPRNQAGGENIAMGYRTPADVMDGWMNSAGHRANILTCAFKAIGVGLAKDSSNTPYWTQVFGRS